MEKYPLLEKVNSPRDLKKLESGKLPLLCSEIREFLVDSVSKTGGHLASNLGAVELSVGIHRVFDSPKDRIIFDVGHQSYVHKILTGRREAFSTLRQLDGISGFMKPEESIHDPVITGHASSSVSSALGIARGNRIAGRDSKTVAVIGDGALTGGMAYEALNDLGASGLPVVVVFNDNDMSISRNVGAIAGRLAKIRLKPRYFRAKEKVKAALRRLPKGKYLISGVSGVKDRIRTALLKETIFEIMGMKYLGPADGNDISVVCSLLEEAAKMNGPVVVHFKTVKGKGFPPSEQKPGSFHGVPAFDRKKGPPSSGKNFSSAFGDIMCTLAAEDKRICAVTAAMEDGTGLHEYREKYPERFFDVGIAEGHAVAMASGLAVAGCLPVCAVYSTFLQRAYDQLIHDSAIAGTHLVLAVDRAGLVGEDGPTHHGVFDISYLMSIPGMRVFSPSSYAEMASAMRKAVCEVSGPAAVRYPRGKEGSFTEDTFKEPWKILRRGEIWIASYGMMINTALKAAEMLEKHGISAGVIKINELTAWDPAAAGIENAEVWYLEDCLSAGSLGSRFGREINLGMRFVPGGKTDLLLERCGLDAASVCKKIAGELG